MASTKGLEPLTVRLEGACSIQLSYVDIGNCLIIIAESPDDFKPFMKKVNMAYHALFRTRNAVFLIPVPPKTRSVR